MDSSASAQLPIERFTALEAVPSIQHAFIARVAGIDVASDKAEALRRLDGVHREVRRSLGVAEFPFVTAEQVHGRGVAVVDAPVSSDHRFAGCDGVVTNQRGLLLGIYVADCGAVFLVDPVRRAIGLVHSGKKGTELGIVGNAIELMRERFGSAPEDLIVQLGPCIRPPHYEIDFAADVIRQCRERGVGNVHDSGVCTACDLDRYYSYRAEKSRTGRMLALLALV
ncbi:MAG: FIG00003370: Multicopper polyphenol oxidase [uncultured Chthoniobacterales bacterium]|uniref:FIG00003370: Multicopper polyphenol oxidase n=1 Tax=uncultured Chthoniobacterales bacterium TaxID=1836801 RepID=A0A6J4HMT1_9BACT|nr:MAG: FIG00003370: Multicopper polyphenol oxidase [uncultured Chthoniobacterales bacterium]